MYAIPNFNNFISILLIYLYCFFISVDFQFHNIMYVQQLSKFQGFVHTSTIDFSKLLISHGIEESSMLAIRQILIYMGQGGRSIPILNSKWWLGRELATGVLGKQKTRDKHVTAVNKTRHGLGSWLGIRASLK
jgi:hypothetical protein